MNMAVEFPMSGCDSVSESADADQSVRWCVVRMKRLQNPGRNTTVLGANYETYKNRQGAQCHRRIKRTGQRVSVHQVLLERAGFEVFLPVSKSWERVNRFSNEKHLVSRPLLVGWCFVGWPENQSRWADLAALNVVTGILGAHGRPVEFSQAYIQKLMKRYGGKVETKRPEEPALQDFKVGERVRVVSGPFEDFDLRISELGSGHAKGVLEFLGREQSVEMELENIARIQGVKC